MSRDVDSSDLNALELDDLKYLHDRNQITDQEFAEALGVSTNELTTALRNGSQNQLALEDRPNTGDANTAGRGLETEDNSDDDDDDEEEEDDGILRPPYDREGVTNDMLRAEIVRRNEDRDEDDQLSVSGKKDDLIAILESDDEDNDEE